MIREIAVGGELDLSLLPAPFPGWRRHTPEARREALWARWRGLEWEVLVAAGDPPTMVAGRLGGEEASVRFWGGGSLSAPAAAQAVDALLPPGPWWVSYPACSPALTDALAGRGADGGTVAEFLLDLADVALDAEGMTSRVAPLGPEHREEGFALLAKVATRTRWQRVGDPQADERLFATLQALGEAGHPPLGAWHGDRLVGVAHIAPWSEHLGVWRVTMAAVDPALGEVVPTIQDLWLGWEGRLGHPIPAVRLGVPALAEEQIALLAKAGPASLWLRRLGRGLG